MHGRYATQSELLDVAYCGDRDALANAEHAWRDPPVLPQTQSLPLDRLFALALNRHTDSGQTP